MRLADALVDQYFALSRKSCNSDFKVSVKSLEIQNGTRRVNTYTGGLIESCVWSIERRHFQ